MRSLAREIGILCVAVVGFVSAQQPDAEALNVSSMPVTISGAKGGPLANDLCANATSVGAGSSLNPLVKYSLLLRR